MFYQRFSNFNNVHEDTKVALSNLSNNLLYTFVSAERVFSILDEKPMVEEINMGEKILDTNIVYDNVSFSYK